MAAPSLKLEEYQYSDTGVLLNGSSNGLPFTDVESIEGLDSPDFRQQTHDREGVDGGYLDAQFETMRTINITGTVYADPNRLETYLDSLKANFAPSTVNKPLYMQTDAGQRAIWGKSLGFKYTKGPERRLGIIPFQVQIMCEDPRMYSSAATVQTATLVAIQTSGRSYPKSYPLIYGAAQSNDTLTLTLSGNRPTPAKIRINGPVVNPAVSYDNTGTVMSFQMTIPSGQYIEIDLNAKSVLLNGTTNRRNMMKLSGSWFFLSPGDNNFRFSGTQSPATPLAKLTVTATSAWR